MLKKIALRVYKHAYSFAKKNKINPRYLRAPNRIATRLLRSKYTIINGNKMYLDKDDSLQLSTKGSHEEYITSLIKQHVKVGDTVIDIGAHIGYYSLLMAGLVGQRGNVIAIEAHPKNFELLQKNIELNGYENITAINKAASDTKKEISLYLDKSGSARHSIIKDNSYCSKPITIEAAKIDDLVTTPIDFVKVDIEGAEILALKGMQNTIKRSEKMVIISEFTPMFMKAMDVDPKDYIDLLKTLGFEVFNIDEKNMMTETFDIKKVQEYIKRSHPKAVNTNILCIKDERQF